MGKYIEHTNIKWNSSENLEFCELCFSAFLLLCLPSWIFVAVSGINLSTVNIYSAYCLAKTTYNYAAYETAFASEANATYWGSSLCLRTEWNSGETEAEVVNGMSNNGEMADLPLILFYPALGWVLEMVLGADCHWRVSPGAQRYKETDL